MRHPLQITHHNIALSEAVEQKIRSKVARLEQFSGRMISCHVTVDKPHHHKHKGELYDVRINIAVPGEELVVRHESHEDVYVAIRDAFRAAERKLKQHTERRSGEARLHSG